MDKHFSEWLDLPINIFVDTQVFINESYDFGKKGKFDFLRKQIESGNAILLTSNIVKGEVERHIREDVSRIVEKFNNVVEDRRFAVFRGSQYFESIKQFDKSEMIDEAISIFNIYLEEVKAITLDVDTIDLKRVISDYFSGNAPFGEKHKKSEFPDAFNSSMLKEYALKSGKIYVVSNDGDFANIESIYCFETLGELLDALNSQDDICQKVKQYLKNKSSCQYIFNKIEIELLDRGFDIEVDGRDVGRKGEWDGYEYEECELLSEVPLELSNGDVVDIDYNNKIITIMVECRTKMEFDCSFFDEENSVWDPCNKEYTDVHYGTIHEIHKVMVPIRIDIVFEAEENEVEFEIEDIEIDTSIRLDQHTLIKNGRERMDNPYSFWEDNEGTINNPCPACGREIKFKNDGGNGFCLDCAPDH